MQLDTLEIIFFTLKLCNVKNNNKRCLSINLSTFRLIELMCVAFKI